MYSSWAHPGEHCPTADRGGGGACGHCDVGGYPQPVPSANVVTGSAGQRQRGAAGSGPRRPSRFDRDTR